jgi:hypothetical protein
MPASLLEVLGEGVAQALIGSSLRHLRECLQNSFLGV